MALMGRVEQVEELGAKLEADPGPVTALRPTWPNWKAGVRAKAAVSKNFCVKRWERLRQ